MRSVVFGFGVDGHQRTVATTMRMTVQPRPRKMLQVMSTLEIAIQQLGYWEITAGPWSCNSVTLI